MQVQTVRLMEPLVSPQELQKLVAKYGAGSPAIKEELERFPAFEYYGLTYLCPVGHEPVSRIDWHYTQEEALIIDQWFEKNKV